MSPRPALLRRLAEDRRGAVAVMLALSLPLVVGMMSLGVEAGLWFAEKRDLQNAADAGALSGAFELAAGRTTTVTAAAISDALRNGFDGGGGIPATVNAPPKSGKYIGDASAVEVILQREQKLLLSTLFLGSASVTGRAVAKSGSPGDYCVIALDKVDSSAVDINGSADINLGDCGVMANSSDPQALTVSGSSTLTADFIEMVGEYSKTGAANLVVGQTITHSTAIDDPYKAVAMPAVGGCDHTKFKATDSTMSPGVYCDGIDFGAQAEVTMAPGTYIVDGGSVSVNGGARVTGDGVTIVLTGTGSDYATVSINGGATVDLSAPTSGAMKGMVIYQDRSAPAGVVNKLNGGSTTQFTGVLYFPSQEVQFTGGNSTGPAGCTRIVAQTVSFSGNATIGNDCAGTGVDPNRRRPYLVE